MGSRLEFRSRVRRVKNNAKITAHVLRFIISQSLKLPELLKKLLQALLSRREKNKKMCVCGVFLFSLWQIHLPFPYHLKIRYLSLSKTRPNKIYTLKRCNSHLNLELCCFPPLERSVHFTALPLAFLIAVCRKTVSQFSIDIQPFSLRRRTN